MACGRWYRCCYRINPTLMWGLIQAAIWSHLLWLWLQYGEVGYSWTHTNKTNLIKMKMFPWHSMRDKAKTVHSYKFIHILLKQKTNQWIPVFFFGNRCRSKKNKKNKLKHSCICQGPAVQKDWDINYLHDEWRNQPLQTFTWDGKHVWTLDFALKQHQTHKR